MNANGQMDDRCVQLDTSKPLSPLPVCIANIQIYTVIINWELAGPERILRAAYAFSQYLFSILSA